MKDSRIVRKNQHLALRQSRLAAAQLSVKEDFTDVHWKAHCQVQKWNPDQLRWISSNTGIPLVQVEKMSGDSLRSLLAAEEVTDVPGNLLTYTGLAYLLGALTGSTATTTATYLTNGYVPVGVGDGNGSTPTPTTADSDLTAPTNKYYQPADATYPAVGAAGATAGVLTVQATYTSAVANFAWNEWALFGTTVNFTVGQATTPLSTTMINHKGASIGTKSSGNVWSLVSTITFS